MSRQLDVQTSRGVVSLLLQPNIVVEPGAEESFGFAEHLATVMRPSTGYPVVASAAACISRLGEISASTSGGGPGLGKEGNLISVSSDQVIVSAIQPPGVFKLF